MTNAADLLGLTGPYGTKRTASANNGMPPNLAAIAQRNLAKADAEINRFNLTARMATRQPSAPTTTTTAARPVTPAGATPAPTITADNPFARGASSLTLNTGAPAAPTGMSFGASALPAVPAVASPAASPPASGRPNDSWRFAGFQGSSSQPYNRISSNGAATAPQSQGVADATSDGFLNDKKRIQWGGGLQ